MFGRRGEKPKIRQQPHSPKLLSLQDVERSWFANTVPAEMTPKHMDVVTPKRMDVPPATAQPFLVEVKCAWCNAASEQREPRGTWPSTYRCDECGLQSEILPGSHVTRIVPSDTVARQIMRGEAR
jgi:hypothetical protein